MYKNIFKKTYNQISDFDITVQETIEIYVLSLIIDLRINFASQDK